MIMTRTPLRISLGGGGTDLPSFYQQEGGFVLSAAINRYVYLSVHRSFFPRYLLRYSQVEEVERIEQIRHPLMREMLARYSIEDPLEIVSVADVPSGTGLGSSGSFAVGLAHALFAYRRHSVTAEQLAQEAIAVEMEQLREPVGKQDPYIAAYGGLLCQHYHSDGSVSLAPLAMSESALHELRDSLMLFFLGRTRAASTLLSDQKKRSEEQDQSMLANLRATKALGHEVCRVLGAGEVEALGPLMHEHWMQKRSRSAGMSNERIDQLYTAAQSEGGATGGKLVGAGGSGFLLFQTKDRKRLRDTMARHGLAEMDFQFDFDGSVVLLRNQ